MTIIWDLDGTILNVSERYYRLYTDLLSESGYGVLGKEEYWELKRNKIRESDILERTGAGTFYNNYQKQRKGLIEDTGYLEFDKVSVKTCEVLEKLSENFRLILVTLRNSSKRLHAQLDKLSLTRYFNQVLNSGDKRLPGWKVKYQLILSGGAINNKCGGYFIGDTETDILAGKALRLRTVAVSYGIRNKVLLEKEAPDFIFGSVEKLCDFVHKRIV